MPTGYTQPLYDGEPITFEQFVLRCSRAMGAAIMQRDDSLDVEIQLREISDYEMNALAKAQTDLSAALIRTDAEWAAKQDAEIAAAATYRRDYLAKTTAISNRYRAMLAQVKAWRPPTLEHEGLKSFMVDQIEQSSEFDAGSYQPTVPEALPVEEYRAAQVAFLARQLDSATTRLKEERDRVRGQNAWVTALRDSLGVSA